MNAQPNQFYALYGLSKLVYPVDDLFTYLTMQGFSDILRNWYQIDEEYEHIFEQYIKDRKEGIQTKTPDRGQFFMSNLQALAIKGIIQHKKFNEIYNETRIWDTDGTQKGSKANDFIERVRHNIRKCSDFNKTLNELYDECSQCNMELFEPKTLDDDLEIVYLSEKYLKIYRRTAAEFIEKAKTSMVKECIQGIDMAMHPLALRYFLYEVRDSIKNIIENLRDENCLLRREIGDYEEVFDDPETDTVETATDLIKRANKNTTAFHKLIGKNHYKEAIEYYGIVSREQADKIKQYTQDKLLEETLGEILHIFHRLIEQVESFFKYIPEEVRKYEKEIQEQGEKYENKQDFNVYVLASMQIKKHIYEEIQPAYTLPFEVERSLWLYSTGFHQIQNLVERDAEMYRDLVQNEIIHQLLTENIHFITHYLKKSHPEYAEMNVLQALQKEAEMFSQGAQEASAYMVKQLNTVNQKASIRLSDNPANHIYINSWEIKPACLANDNIDIKNLIFKADKESDMILNQQQLNSTMEANLLATTLSSPLELTRVNRAYLIPISHFIPNKQ